MNNPARVKLRTFSMFVMTIYILKNKFPLDLHIKAYHLNHWLLSLYGFKYLHFSVTLLSQGWNPFPGVCSDLDLGDSFSTLPLGFATVAFKLIRTKKDIHFQRSSRLSLRETIRPRNRNSYTYKGGIFLMDLSYIYFKGPTPYLFNIQCSGRYTTLKIEYPLSLFPK